MPYARRTVLRVQLTITPDFRWMERVHGGSLRWHIWVEDSDNDEKVYHTEVSQEGLVRGKMRQPVEYKLLGLIVTNKCLYVVQALINLV